MNTNTVSRRRALALGSIGATVGLSGCIGTFVGGSPYKSEVSGGPSDYPETEPVQYEHEIDTRSPVTIEVYSDYQCSYCKDFHENTMPSLRKLYTNFRFVIYQYPLPVGDLSVPLANVVQRVVSEHGAMSDEAHSVESYIYENQNGIRAGDVIGYVAEQTNLTETQITTSMEEGTYNGLLRDHISRGDSFDVNSTPSVVIGGDLIDESDVFNVDLYDEYLYRPSRD